MLGSKPSYLARDRIFVLSLLSVLSMNAITIFLTWLVVFEWKVGFEYNPGSFWQLGTYGPEATLLVTQLTLLGVFLLVKTGMGQIAKSTFRRSLQLGEVTNKYEIRSNYQRISSRYRRISDAVLLSIVAIIALDLANDLIQFSSLFLHWL